MSRKYKVVENYSFIITHKSFKNMAKFKYLGITVTDQNCIHEETKSK